MTQYKTTDDRYFEVATYLNTTYDGQTQEDVLLTDIFIIDEDGDVSADVVLDHETLRLLYEQLRDFFKIYDELPAEPPPAPYIPAPGDVFTLKHTPTARFLRLITPVNGYTAVWIKGESHRTNDHPGRLTQIVFDNPKNTTFIEVDVNV